MIEHTVQHHFDSIVMKVLTYFLEILIGSQPAVNGMIVPRIITVRIRLKYR